LSKQKIAVFKQISKVPSRNSLSINELQNTFRKNGLSAVQTDFFALYPNFHDFTKNLHSAGTKGSEKPIFENLKK